MFRVSYAVVHAQDALHLPRLPGGISYGHPQRIEQGIKPEAAQKLTALETPLSYNGLKLSSFLCLFNITEKKSTLM